METLRTWKQQAWNPQLDVTLLRGAIVEVGGVPVTGDREQALANIIMRLNAQVISLEAKVQELEKR